MKLKKTLLTGLSFVLVAALAIGGTIAYLTSEDSDVNVMTLGNVKIKQHEYQRVEEENGYTTDTIDDMNSYVLEEFEQNKPLYPATESTNNGAGPWDETTVRMSQVDSYGGMQVFVNENAVDKFVTVENTSKSDAYIRTFVAIEVGTADDSLIGTSYHMAWTENNIGTIAIDGVNYYVTEYVYAGAKLSDGSYRHENGVLPAGDTSYPNLSQVYLNSKVTNEDCEKLDGNGNGVLDILVLSQAVQTKGFDDAKTAFDTAFPKGENNANVAEWLGGVLANAAPNGDDDAVTYAAPADAYVVNNDDELAQAVADGKTTLLLKDGTYDIHDCKGKTLNLYGESKNVIIEVTGNEQGEANRQLDYGLDGSIVTFNGVTIKTNNKTYAGYTRLTGTYNDCVIENHYSLNRNSEFNFCTLNVSGDQYNVWTWGASEATFTRCTFNSDGKALLVYNQSCNLTVDSCVFNDNGGLVDEHKAAIEACNGDDGDNCVTHNIIVTNTTVNGFDITSEKTDCGGTSLGTTLWGNKNLLDDDHLNVTVDGNVEY